MDNKSNKCPVWFGRALFGAVFYVVLAFLYKITS